MPRDWPIFNCVRLNSERRAALNPTVRVAPFAVDDFNSTPLCGHVAASSHAWYSWMLFTVISCSLSERIAFTEASAAAMLVQ